MALEFVKSIPKNLVNLRALLWTLLSTVFCCSKVICRSGREDGTPDVVLEVVNAVQV